MRNFILGFLAAAVILTGAYFAHQRGSGRTEVSTQVHVKYHCPMHPDYVSDKPGSCPICGMDLVPMDQGPKAAVPTADDQAGHDMSSMPESKVPGYAAVMLAPDRVQRMGVTLAQVRRINLDQSIRTVGRVTYDETRLQHVHTKFEGFIEHLYVNYVGQLVRKGDPLFSVYSPELYATQKEYLLALRAKEQMKGAGAIAGVDLLEAARQRLSLWDIRESQIHELERTRTPIRELDVYSPVSGFVTAKTAVHGLKVMPGDNLYDIVDLSVVWVIADVYEVNVPFVNVGQPATITLPYDPGKERRGRVVFIEPTLDPTTRTVKARFEFANPDGQLKPEMYADVIFGGARASGIAVPDSAVIATGERNVVFVAKGQGVFEPREVVLGAKVAGLWEIKRGVAVGETVASGANFLLDSESKLKAAAAGAAHVH